MGEFLGRRYHQLFSSDQRSVVIAMDHGVTDGVMPGFKDPGSIIEQVIAGGADAILTSVGIARRFGKELKDVGLLLRCDGGTSPLLEQSRELLVDIETVITSGADAAAAMYFPGIEHGQSSTRYFPRLAAEAHRWNIPIMAEALPYGFEPHPNARTVDEVAVACRMAIENGADIVKTFYTGERESFKEILQSCYTPVLVLGGPKTKNDEEFLEAIWEAMDAGAAGVVIGRNVWQAASPTAMTRALVALVHHNASAAEAVRILHDGR